MVESINDLKKVLNEDETNSDIEYETYGNDGSLIFTASKYHLKFLANLKEFQQNEKFCDVILKTRNNPMRVIRAHKLILASSSEYFRAMFTGGFREDAQCQEVLIDHINYSCLETMVDFMYTGKIVVKETNVQSLLPAAKMLQIEDVVKACCMYLAMNMDATNCIGIEQFAQTYGCVDLTKKAQQYMRDHFCKVINNEEFLHLNEHQLCKLLRSDELSVRCESYVFKAVVDWVKFDPEKRRFYLDHLFQCVRFHFLPPKFLKDQVKNNEIFKLKDTDKSRKYLQQVCDELIAHKPCTSAIPRKPAFPFALYVIGGYQRQSINLVECLKLPSKVWERCADMNIPRSGISCVALALYIYAIGGRNNSVSGNLDCADVECYDPFVNIWKKCCSMSVPRSRAGTGVIDGLIYAAGGAHNVLYHSSVERYYAQEDRWEPVKSMTMPRIGLGCAVVNRLLYAIGGYDGKNRLEQVEAYNPDQNSWSLVAPMNTPRSGAGVGTMDNFIYVIGGYTTNLQLNTAERYDVITNQWTFISSMNTPRSALACVAGKGKIFAFGGYNGTEFLSSVELYDADSDTWVEVTNMSSERSGHGAAVTVEFVH